jgi:hypothetical protein
MHSIRRYVATDHYRFRTRSLATRCQVFGSDAAPRPRHGRRRLPYAAGENRLMKSSPTPGLKCGSALAMLMFLAAAPRSIAGGGEGAPTRIAVFDFELEDDSAGADIAGDRAADDSYMRVVSAEVRRVIEQSGRYRLVDISGADAEAVRDRSLLTCMVARPASHRHWALSNRSSAS